MLCIPGREHRTLCQPVIIDRSQPIPSHHRVVASAAFRDNYGRNALMTDGDLNWIANFTWGIADDVLRDLYVRGKYRIGGAAR